MQKYPQHPAYSFLTSRGLDIDDVKKFKLGYIDKSKVIPDLSKTIVIPLYDKEGNIVSVIGRAIYNGPGFKYKIASNYRFFKGEYLYGFNFIKETSRKTVYIVEGVFDAIHLIKRGYAALATLGASLSQKQAAELLTQFREIVVAYDYDEAGLKSSLKIFQEYGNKVQFALPVNKQGKYIKDYGEGDAIPKRVSIEEIAIEYYKILREHSLKQKSMYCAPYKWQIDLFLSSREQKHSVSIKTVNDILLLSDKIKQSHNKVKKDVLSEVIKFEIEKDKEQILKALKVI
jgi:DNA primase